jgi:hypothetical protein
MLNKPSSARGRVSVRQVYLALLAPILMGIALSGCAGKKDARSTPSETARQSLNAALTAWQNGQPAGEMASVSPPVQVVDSVWAKGRKLQSYEILSEQTEADGLRSFLVRLNLEGPKGSEEVRYIVKGRSPVWIYRQEDHERARSWEGYK